jgi:hypothetical protein
MNDRAARIANLTPEQRRLLELMLQERAQARADEGIPALPRYSEILNLDRWRRTRWRMLSRRS